jgi:4-amino-4-deoxy-L-arabinose transferase-like glycosyltransferase
MPLSTHPSTPTQAPLGTSAFLLFWVVVAAACLWGIWGGSLDTWDEALTGERSQEMFRQGWSMTVYRMGQPDFNKPPLYYWLSAAGFSLFGLGEFAVRLPSALMGLACAVAVYLLARGYGLGRNGGLLAVFLLIASPHWLNVCREGLLDSGMTLSMLLALWAFAFHPDRMRGALWAGLSLAFGFWIKNPGVLLVLPAMLVHARGQERPQYWRILVVLAVALLFGSGWYVHQCAEWGDKFTRFYFDYNFGQRFTRDFQGHSSEMHFYLRQLFKRSPHVLVLAAIAAAAWALRRYRPDTCFKAPGAFVLSWVLLVHLMHSKRDPYIAPIYPFFALAAACFLSSFASGWRGSARLKLAGAVLGVLMLATWIGHYDFRLDRNRGLVEAVRFISGHCPAGPVYGLNIHTHVASFYLDGRVSDLADNATGIPESGACVLYNSKKSAHLPDELSGAAQVWSGKDGYSVWSLPVAGRSQSP